MFVRRQISFFLLGCSKKKGERNKKMDPELATKASSSSTRSSHQTTSNRRNITGPKMMLGKKSGDGGVISPKLGLSDFAGVSPVEFVSAQRSSTIPVMVGSRNPILSLSSSSSESTLSTSFGFSSSLTKINPPLASLPSSIPFEKGKKKINGRSTPESSGLECSHSTNGHHSTQSSVDSSEVKKQACLCSSQNTTEVKLSSSLLKNSTPKPGSLTLSSQPSGLSSPVSMALTGMQIGKVEKESTEGESSAEIYQMSSPSVGIEWPISEHRGSVSSSRQAVQSSLIGGVLAKTSEKSSSDVGNSTGGIVDTSIPALCSDMVEATVDTEKVGEAGALSASELAKVESRGPPRSSSLLGSSWKNASERTSSSNYVPQHAGVKAQAKKGLESNNSAPSHQEALYGQAQSGPVDYSSSHVLLDPVAASMKRKVSNAPMCREIKEKEKDRLTMSPPMKGSFSTNLVPFSSLNSALLMSVKGRKGKESFSPVLGPQNSDIPANIQSETPIEIGSSEIVETKTKNVANVTQQQKEKAIFAGDADYVFPAVRMVLAEAADQSLMNSEKSMSSLPPPALACSSEGTKKKKKKKNAFLTVHNSQSNHSSLSSSLQLSQRVGEEDKQKTVLRDAPEPNGPTGEEVKSNDMLGHPHFLEQLQNSEEFKGEETSSGELNFSAITSTESFIALPFPVECSSPLKQKKKGKKKKGLSGNSLVTAVNSSADIRPDDMPIYSDIVSTEKKNVSAVEPTRRTGSKAASDTKLASPTSGAEKGGAVDENNRLNDFGGSLFSSTQVPAEYSNHIFPISEKSNLETELSVGTSNTVQECEHSADPRSCFIVRSPHHSQHHHHHHVHRHSTMPPFPHQPSKIPLDCRPPHQDPMHHPPSANRRGNNNSSTHGFSNSANMSQPPLIPQSHNYSAQTNIYSSRHHHQRHHHHFPNDNNAGNVFHAANGVPISNNFPHGGGSQINNNKGFPCQQPPRFPTSQHHHHQQQQQYPSHQSYSMPSSSSSLSLPGPSVGIAGNYIMPSTRSAGNLQTQSSQAFAQLGFSSTPISYSHQSFGGSTPQARGHGMPPSLPSSQWTVCPTPPSTGDKTSRSSSQAGGDIDMVQLGASAPVGETELESGGYSNAYPPSSSYGSSGSIPYLQPTSGSGSVSPCHMLPASTHVMAQSSSNINRYPSPQDQPNYPQENITNNSNDAFNDTRYPYYGRGMTPSNTYYTSPPPPLPLQPPAGGGNALSSYPSPSSFKQQYSSIHAPSSSSTLSYSNSGSSSILPMQSLDNASNRKTNNVPGPTGSHTANIQNHSMPTMLSGGGFSAPSSSASNISRSPSQPAVAQQTHNSLSAPYYYYSRNNTNNPRQRPFHHHHHHPHSHSETDMRGARQDNCNRSESSMGVNVGNAGGMGPPFPYHSDHLHQQSSQQKQQYQDYGLQQPGGIQEHNISSYHYYHQQQPLHQDYSHHSGNRMNSNFNFRGHSIENSNFCGPRSDSTGSNIDVAGGGTVNSFSVPYPGPQPPHQQYPTHLSAQPQLLQQLYGPQKPPTTAFPTPSQGIQYCVANHVDSVTNSSPVVAPMGGSTAPSVSLSLVTIPSPQSSTLPSQSPPSFPLQQPSMLQVPTSSFSSSLTSVIPKGTSSTHNSNHSTSSSSAVLLPSCTPLYLGMGMAPSTSMSGVVSLSSAVVVNSSSSPTTSSTNCSSAEMTDKPFITGSPATHFRNPSNKSQRHLNHLSFPSASSPVSNVPTPSQEEKQEPNNIASDSGSAKTPGEDEMSPRSGGNPSQSSVSPYHPTVPALAAVPILMTAFSPSRVLDRPLPPASAFSSTPLTAVFASGTPLSSSSRSSSSASVRKRCSSSKTPSSSGMTTPDTKESAQTRRKETSLPKKTPEILVTSSKLSSSYRDSPPCNSSAVSRSGAHEGMQGRQVGLRVFPLNGTVDQCAVQKRAENLLSAFAQSSSRSKQENQTTDDAVFATNEKDSQENLPKGSLAGVTSTAPTPTSSNTRSYSSSNNEASSETPMKRPKVEGWSTQNDAKENTLETGLDDSFSSTVNKKKQNNEKQGEHSDNSLKADNMITTPKESRRSKSINRNGVSIDDDEGNQVFQGKEKLQKGKKVQDTSSMPHCSFDSLHPVVTSGPTAALRAHNSAGGDNPLPCHSCLENMEIDNLQRKALRSEAQRSSCVKEEGQGPIESSSRTRSNSSKKKNNSKNNGFTQTYRGEGVHNGKHLPNCAAGSTREEVVAIHAIPSASLSVSPRGTDDPRIHRLASSISLAEQNGRVGFVPSPSLVCKGESSCSSITSPHLTSSESSGIGMKATASTRENNTTSVKVDTGSSTHPSPVVSSPSLKRKGTTTGDLLSSEILYLTTSKIQSLDWSGETTPDRHVVGKEAVPSEQVRENVQENRMQEEYEQSFSETYPLLGEEESKPSLNDKTKVDSLVAFTPEVHPELARLVEEEVLQYLIPTAEGLRIRRFHLGALAYSLSEAIMHIGPSTRGRGTHSGVSHLISTYGSSNSSNSVNVIHGGKINANSMNNNSSNNNVFGTNGSFSSTLANGRFGQIRMYIFGSVNMRTVLPDGDNDVTLEIDGLVANPEQAYPISPAVLSYGEDNPVGADGRKGGGRVSTMNANGLLNEAGYADSSKTSTLPLTTDSSAGNPEGTLQLTTTSEGQPFLVKPIEINLAAGELLKGVRDYLTQQQDQEWQGSPRVYVDTLVSAEVQVLKLMINGYRFDVTVGQTGGVNCAQFFHTMDELIGRQHLLKRTMLLLKAWLSYEAHILGGQGGYLGSYTVSIMLISMLNIVEFLEDMQEEEEHLKAKKKEENVSKSKRGDTLNSVLQDAMERTTSATSSKEDQRSNLNPTNPSPDKNPVEEREEEECEDPPSIFFASHVTPLVLFARFLKYFSYFDFSNYCVTAFGPLRVTSISKWSPCDLSDLEVPTAKLPSTEKPSISTKGLHEVNVGSDGVGAPSSVEARNTAHGDSQHNTKGHNASLPNKEASRPQRTPKADLGPVNLEFLGLTSEGQAAIGHLIRRRQRPLLTVSGVKHLLHDMNVGQHQDRQQRYERCKKRCQASQPYGYPSSTSPSSFSNSKQGGIGGAHVLPPTCSTSGGGRAVGMGIDPHQCPYSLSSSYFGPHISQPSYPYSMGIGNMSGHQSSQFSMPSPMQDSYYYGYSGYPYEPSYPFSSDSPGEVSPSQGSMSGGRHPYPYQTPSGMDSGSQHSMPSPQDVSQKDIVHMHGGASSTSPPPSLGGVGPTLFSQPSYSFVAAPQFHSLNKRGRSEDDVGLLCSSCTTLQFPVRMMNVLDPLRWSSNMTRGVSMNHMQRIILAFREGMKRLEWASAKLEADILLYNELRRQMEARVRGEQEKDIAGSAYCSHRSGLSTVGKDGCEDGNPRSSGRSAHTTPDRGESEHYFSRDFAGGLVDGVEAAASLFPCSGYPSPYSVCTVGEADILQYLFGQTIYTIQKFSESNFPWPSNELSVGPQCTEPPPGCQGPSIFCTQGLISKMCEPQCCIDPPWLPSGTEKEMRELRHLGCLGETMIPEDNYLLFSENANDEMMMETVPGREGEVESMVKDNESREVVDGGPPQHYHSHNGHPKIGSTPTTTSIIPGGDGFDGVEKSPEMSSMVISSCANHSGPPRCTFTGDPRQGSGVLTSTLSSGYTCSAQHVPSLPAYHSYPSSEAGVRATSSNNGNPYRAYPDRNSRGNSSCTNCSSGRSSMSGSTTNPHHMNKMGNNNSAGGGAWRNRDSSKRVGTPSSMKRMGAGTDYGVEAMFSGKAVGNASSVSLSKSTPSHYSEAIREGVDSPLTSFVPPPRNQPSSFPPPPNIFS